MKISVGDYLKSRARAVILFAVMLALFTWLRYSYYRIFLKSINKKKELIFVFAPMMVMALCTVISPATKWVFYIDNLNYYHRGVLSPEFSVVLLIYLMSASVMALRQYGKEKMTDRKKELLMISFFPVIPFFGGCAQTVFYGCSILWPSTTAALLLIYINNENRAISQDPLTGMPESYYFAFRKNDVALKNKVDAAISQILSGDVDYFTKLKNKYETQFKSNILPFSGAEKKYISQHKTLLLGVVDNDEPFYTSSGSDNIIRDYYKLVSEYAGFKIKYKVYDTQEKMISAENSGKIDAIALYSDGVITAYQKGLALTDAYSSVSNILLAKRGSDGSKARKIAAKKSTIDSLNENIDDVFPDAELVGYESARDCFDAMPPSDINDFRARFPLTEYQDYADVLLQKNGNMLPDHPIIWIQTTCGKFCRDHKISSFARIRYSCRYRSSRKVRRHRIPAAYRRRKYPAVSTHFMCGRLFRCHEPCLQKGESQ